MRILILLPLVFLTWCASLKAVESTDTEREFSVTMIVPETQSNPFYMHARDLMLLAAKDLHIELEFLYANNDPTALVDIAASIADRQAQPDYVLLVGVRGSTEFAIRLLDEAGIKTAIAIATLSPENIHAFTNGASKLKHWVGSLVPNEQQAGYLLAQQLHKEALRLDLGEGQKIRTLALLGSKRSPASELRLKGMKRYVRETPTLHLDHHYYAEWKKDLAEAYTFRSLSAGDRIKVIWSANDAMAIGAIEAAKKSKRDPGRDILVGGVDWIPAISPYIENRKLLGSAGGHVLDGAWMLVLLHDHHHDAVPEFFQYESKFAFADKDNRQLMKKIQNLDFMESIDFKDFSKLRRLEPFDFGIDLITQP